MAPFDLILNTGKAYHTTWNERAYLLRLALVPILLKIVCYVVVFTEGYQDNVLRMTLIMLPSLFVEGWMLSHYTRLIFLGQRWPFKPTGNLEQDMMTLRARARGVLAGTIVYVLIAMAISAVMAGLIPLMPQTEAAASNTRPEIALLVLVVFAATLWAFRHTFLYVGYAVNLDIRFFTKILPGFMASFRLMGLWLLCSVPFFVVLGLVDGLVDGLISTGMSESKNGTFIMIIAISIIETIKNLVLTCGVAYVLLELYTREKEQA
jgi:hypothetical protein